MRLVGATLVLATLSACQSPGGPSGISAGGPPGAGFATAGPARAASDNLTEGHRLMALGDYEKALHAYLRAANEQGLTAEILSALGSANLRLGRLGQAEKLLRKAIEVDPHSVPAWNNLGVVLVERGQYGEAKRVFETAFALDAGNSEQIRQNLKLAIAKLENPAYDAGKEENFELVRRGNGRYLLLQTP